ncbi:hypothetical protein [Sphingomonas sp. UYP23]
MTDPHTPEDRTDDAATEGSLPQEDVADRPNITPVKPEDYPEQDRAKGG